MSSLNDFLNFKAEIDHLMRDLRVVDAALSKGQRASFDQRVESILIKMEALWLEEAAPAAESVEILAKVEEVAPETPTEVLVKQAGDARPCSTCGGTMPCMCFGGLPDPKITVEDGGLFKIEFPAEYTSFDRLNFLSAMRLVLAKRKAK